MKWSFSADKCFRRCQRQYFFRAIAAWHNAKKDPLRRAAFLQKQLKTLELWRGLLVHEGIELFVVPRLEARERIPWQEVIEGTLAMARRQLAFSAARRYREDGMTKASHPHEYCALAPHDEGREIPADQLEGVFDDVRTAFQNLSGMEVLLAKISGRGKYWAEVPVIVKFLGAHIEVRPDLLFFRRYGKPTIVDWKVYRGALDSDADLQTGLYAWALCRHEKWRVSRAEDVELIEVQLLEGKVIQHACTSELFEELEDRIYRSIHDIRALCGDHKYAEQDLADFAYAGSQNSCAYCSFRSLCLER
jgi:hypothetical protein